MLLKNCQVLIESLLPVLFESLISVLVSIGKNKMEDNPRMANIANILMNWEERKDII